MGIQHVGSDIRGRGRMVALDQSRHRADGQQARFNRILEANEKFVRTVAGSALDAGVQGTTA